MCKSKGLERQSNTYLKTIIGGIIILAACFLAYSNSFFVPFQFDDHPQIVDKVLLRSLDGFNDLERWFNPNQRPVSFFSLALNYRLSTLSVMPYHLVNLSLHVVFCLLCFGFARWLLRRACPALKDNALWAASMFIALLCALHPLQTQAVTYIVQRMAILAGIGYVGACWAYVSARVSHMEKGWHASLVGKYLLVVFCIYFGVMSKQNAITVPLVLAVLEAFFVRGKNGKANWWIIIGVPLAFALFSVIAAVNMDLVSKDSKAISRGMYFATQCLVLFHYFRLMLLPYHQNVDHDFPVADGMLEPAVLVALAGHLAILFIAWQLRNKEKLVSFGIFWFYLAISVESSIIPIRDVMVEHRLYIPLFGFALIVTALLLKIRQLKLTWAIMASIVVFAGILTYQRNEVWQSELALWNDAVSKSPGKARPHFGAGRAYHHAGALEKAMHHLNEAVRLDPENVKALNEIGLVHFELGRPEKAIALYQRSLQLKPRNAKALINIGLAWEELGIHEEAMRHYKMAEQIEPNNPLVHYNIGNILLATGRGNTAVEHYKQALDMDPGYAKAWYNMGNAYYQMGDTAGAITAYERAVAVLPTFAMAWNNLGNMWFLKGEKDKAANCYGEVLRIDPDNEQANINLRLLKQ